MTDRDRLTAALADRYRVERELGEGGMAMVYLAEDLKHDRRVAIKVLKPELAAVVGADRFLAEIRTTANLQHPHILPLFDSGEADGFLFYVMPFVEDESLRERLNRERQLPVEEAIRIASDVGEALDYAHRHGVIHRDIKPANVLMIDGRPVVSDFGIALAVGASGGGRVTETGMSLGTPHYMSPEQATGDQSVGPATDIYALGCVLFEMLVGEPPHTGSTAQAVLGRILMDPPASVMEQRTSVPANADAAIRKALEKLPADRFTRADEFVRALGDPGFRHGPVARPARTDSYWNRLSAGTTAVAAALGVALAWSILRPPPPVPVSRYGLALAPGQDLVGNVTLAPDASSIVYVGTGSPNGQLWVKRRDELEATALAGTDGAILPTVSPDGQWVLYIVDAGDERQLRKIPIAGGASTALADSVQVRGPTGAAWLADGTIVYVDESWRLRRMPAGGGEADSVWAAPNEMRARSPIQLRALPDSRGVLFTLCDGYCRRVREIWALDLRSGEAHRVVRDALLAEYASIGQLVYVRTDGSVFAAPFDLNALETTGPGVPVAQGVLVIAGAVPVLAFSRSGTLLMLTGNASSNLSQFVWASRTGAATPVDSSWSSYPGSSDWGWALSPDGKRLAARLNTEAGDNIWIKELPKGALSRLTLDSAADLFPHWSPDGRSVTFVSNRPVHDTIRFRVWTKRADGVGDASLLFSYSRDLIQGFWSPDGEWLVARTGASPGTTGGRDIIAMHPGEDTAAVIITAAGYDMTAPAVSPDSRWIAYVSNETGRDEVFVRPFPNVNDGRWQVSTDGGDAPIWAHSGHELFYISGREDVVAVPVQTTPSFSPGASRVLFHVGRGAGYLTPNWCCQWDVAPDDQRFLMARLAGLGDPDDVRIILVENWFEELKARVPN